MFRKLLVVLLGAGFVLCTGCAGIARNIHEIQYPRVLSPDEKVIADSIQAEKEVCDAYVKKQLATTVPNQLDSVTVKLRRPMPPLYYSAVWAAFNRIHVEYKIKRIAFMVPDKEDGHIIAILFLYTSK